MFGVGRHGDALITEAGSLFDEVQPAPTGTVTFLFTDIEGSTRLLQSLGRRYADLQAAHQRAIRAACRAWGGYEVDTQGDSFLWAFQSAADAIQAAVAAQKKMDDLGLMIDGPASNHQTSVINHQSSVPLRVRMSLHTGEPTLVNGRYIGLDVNRGARICAAAHGGQVLLSPTARDLVEGSLPDGVTLRDMGEHRLKDLRRSRRLYQLVIPGRDNDFPPLRTLTAHRNNLPVQATSLVDREAECKALRDLLTRDTVRLVTLTGPGGVGKTRLALHTAAEMFDLFPDGVFFVPLASVTDPELVLSAIAQALDLHETGGKSLLENLRAALKDRQMLLVLDNFEQVTHAGRLIAQLLQAAPAVKALVTSRAVLRVYGEQEFGVQPLPIPVVSGQWSVVSEHSPNPASPDASTHYASRITEYPSVQLFVQRAQMVRPDFQVTPENAAAVAAICARLDGLPLAIELAAARVKLLSPQAMLPRLDRRLALLTSGSRDLPLRQQTLRASIDWSYDLLDEAERAVFRRLAVFVGGFTLDAVEEVVNGTEDGNTENSSALDALPPMLDALEALVNESLVQQSEDAAGETRFSLLETIREYALERLDESGEGDTLRRRHALHFRVFAAEAAPHLVGAEQAGYLNGLQREHDNLRAALVWARDKQADEALRLVTALWLFWYLRGYWTEGRNWLETVLRLPGSKLEDKELLELRTKALNGVATIASAQGDSQIARTFYEECLAILQSLGDQRGSALVLGQLGMVSHSQGDLLKAKALLEQSVQLLRDLDSPQRLGWSLNNLGLVVRDLGDFPLARHLYEESLALKRAENDLWSVARILNNLGEVAKDQGDYEAAEAFLQESLTLSREVGDKWSVAEALSNLGRIAKSRKDYPQAEQLFLEGLAVRQDLGHKIGVAECLKELGILAHYQGHEHEAQQLLTRSLSVLQQIEDQAGISEVQGWLAKLN